MRTEGVLFRVGTHVVIRPEGLEALGGVVRWIKRDFAGIEFDRAIYPPAVDYLVQMNRAGAELALVRD